jgi:AraC-like DNA-binding protein
LAGGAVECQGASFQHPAPRDVSEYRRVFGPNLEFGAPTNSLTFQSAVLDLPVRYADPALSDYLRAQALAMLERLPAAGELRQRVRQAVAERLSEATEIRLIARRLGVSSRTLQRSLREEGTSFQEIRDEVRRCVSLDLLRERNLSVSEVAALVGFANTSAFRSALRRWTGGSARDARRAARELAGSAEN